MDGDGLLPTILEDVAAWLDPNEVHTMVVSTVGLGF